MRAPATQPEPQRTRHATLVVMLLGALLIPTGLASGANRSPVPTVGTVELRPARAAERLGFGQVHQRNRAAQAASTADQYMTEPQAELAVLKRRILTQRAVHAAARRAAIFPLPGSLPRVDVHRRGPTPDSR